MTGRSPACIFAKPATPTEVKTRLIPVLGAVNAASLASAMLRDVWQTVALSPGLRPVLATTVPGVFPVPVSPDDVWLQGEGDLGERIERILIRGLIEAPAAMAIAADAPALAVAHLEAALDAIRTVDAVIGPTADGGFYLLALRKCPTGLFSSLPWSTSDTCRAVERRLIEKGFSVARLGPLFDVDTPGDLRTLDEYLSADQSSAPATRAWSLLHRGEQPVPTESC